MRFNGWLRIRLDVLDDPTLAGIASRKAAGAVGALLEAVRHGFVGFGSLPLRTRMPWLRAVVLTAAFALRLDEDGHLARGARMIGLAN